MDRVTQSAIDGHPLVRIDFTDLTTGAEFKEVTDAAIQAVSGHEKDSVYTLSIFTGAKYNTEIKQGMAHYMEENKPYVRYGAVVGLDSMKRVLFNPLLKLSGRNNMQLFTDEQSAMAWLSSKD